MQPKDIRKWEIFWHFQGIIKVKFDLKYAKLQSQPLEISGQSKLTYTYIKERVKWKHWVPIGLSNWGTYLGTPKIQLYQGCSSNGSLENTGYSIGVLICVVIKINDQTLFQSILASQRHFNSFTSLLFYI